MLLGTLGASLLGNILVGKGIALVMEIRKDEELQEQVTEKKNGFLMSPHPLTNFKIQKYYQKEPRFNDVYSRDNLPERNSIDKIKDGVYVRNPDEYSDIGTHWITLCVLNFNVTYFDSFGVEHIPKEIKTFIENRSIKTNIFRIQAYDSITCGYFCIRFIDFTLARKTLTDFTNLFSRNNFLKN